MCIRRTSNAANPKVGTGRHLPEVHRSFCLAAGIPYPRPLSATVRAPATSKPETEWQRGIRGTRNVGHPSAKPQPPIQHEDQRLARGQRVELQIHPERVRQTAQLGLTNCHRPRHLPIYRSQDIGQIRAIAPCRPPHGGQGPQGPQRVRHKRTTRHHLARGVHDGSRRMIHHYQLRAVPIKPSRSSSVIPAHTSPFAHEISSPPRARVLLRIAST